jgi:hypothetical protein
MCCEVIKECSYLLKSRIVWSEIGDAKANLVLTQSQ